MPSEIIEGVIEVIGESIGASITSKNEKTQGCGCLLLILIIVGIGGWIWYSLSHSHNTDVIVTNKLSNNRIEFLRIDTNKKDIHEISESKFDKVNINDTIQINIVD